MDSGNDGDVSCFEASDASNIGIACIAAEKKEKVSNFLISGLSLGCFSATTSSSDRMGYRSKVFAVLWKTFSEDVQCTVVRWR